MIGIEHKLKGISQLFEFSLADIRLLQDHLMYKSLKKGELFLKVGAPNHAVAFLQAGLIRGFYNDQEGEEITTGFIETGSLFTDLESFQSDKPSQRNLEALVDCELLVLHRTALQALRQDNPRWAAFEQKYIADRLLAKIKFQRTIANSSASEAYQCFIDHYPMAARFAPRYQIASFLGISPFTLSRVKIS